MNLKGQIIRLRLPKFLMPGCINIPLVFKFDTHTKQIAEERRERSRKEASLIDTRAMSAL